MGMKRGDQRINHHRNAMGLLGLGEQKIPSRVPDVYQKAALEEPEVCLKCFGRAFKQHGRQFICVLCGEDVWLVMPTKEALHGENSSRS